MVRARPSLAYLDIETSFYRTVTVVGLLAPTGFHQWVGRGVTREDLLSVLASAGVCTLVTFNGDRFDLPVLGRALGLRVVETQLGIERQTAGLDGYDAMRLWERYVTLDDAQALETLRAYNREDVMNLPRLEARLEELEGVGMTC